jgi:transcription initiation factor TFIIB
VNRIVESTLSNNYLREIYQEKKKCCEEPNIHRSKEGLIICKSCGLVQGRDLVSKERRAYTQEEKYNRIRTEPKRRIFGNRTQIYSKYKEFYNRDLNSKKKQLYERLNKINNSMVNGWERNLWVAKPKLFIIARKLNIPDYIVETAWRIYVKVAEKKLTMGRSILEFICASLIVASRVNKHPLLIEEIIDIGYSSQRNVFRAVGQIIRKILPKLGMSYTPVKIKTLIYKFSNKLEIHVKNQIKTVNYYKKIAKRGLLRSGKDPKGYAAALLYIALKNTTDFKTQKELAQIAYITEVTLRNRAKELKKILRRK